MGSAFLVLLSLAVAGWPGWPGTANALYAFLVCFWFDVVLHSSVSFSGILAFRLVAGRAPVPRGTSPVFGLCVLNAVVLPSSGLGLCVRAFHPTHFITSIAPRGRRTRGAGWGCALQFLASWRDEWVRLPCFRVFLPTNL